MSYPSSRSTCILFLLSLPIDNVWMHILYMVGEGMSVWRALPCYAGQYTLRHCIASLHAIAMPMPMPSLTYIQGPVDHLAHHHRQVALTPFYLSYFLSLISSFIFSLSLSLSLSVQNIY